jgi:hypothetical protein
MATRAERFRTEMERSGPKRSKQPKRNPSKAPGGRTSRGRKAIYALEDTATPHQPSRKSTRRGKHRTKAATALTNRVEREVSSPGRRHITKG